MTLTQLFSWEILQNFSEQFFISTPPGQFLQFSNIKARNFDKKKKYSAKEVFEEILKEFWERLSKKVSNHQNNIILKVKKSQKILGCIHKKSCWSHATTPNSSGSKYLAGKEWKSILVCNYQSSIRRKISGNW